MQSNNPVFTRAEGFNGRGSSKVSDPSTWGTGYGQGTPQAPGGGYDAPTVDQGRMTLDSVVQKTALTLGVVTVVAAATWIMTGPITDQSALVTLNTLSMVGALGGFVLAMVNSFKRVVSPPLVLAYAAMQGLFVGAFSKVVSTLFDQPDASPLVMQAVLGTLLAVVGTLAAYKILDITVTPKMRRMGVALAVGLIGVMLVNFVLSFFGADFGIAGFGMAGLIFSVIGLAAGIFFLILDFDFVEQGIAAGLPERESWRAAFGLTVTIIWIYINILRILAILRGQD
ncbi:Bax inhibitor-1/YccA family protein [Nocardioides aequoreus]|uniref:Bax inhibitor-1/YccA family protein n=1 Tax=Nocardioides aequoreus TaxID=397278 RepID=UPI0004C2B62C|nr:Bax inhibitor-1/YccA family protein [Nocardioides aequoreus]